jgi:hypothetical protein
VNEILCSNPGFSTDRGQVGTPAIAAIPRSCIVVAAVRVQTGVAEEHGNHSDGLAY